MQDKVKIAHQFFDRLNAHDLDGMDGLRANDFQSENVAGAMDTKGIHQYMQRLMEAFPDLRFDITHTIAADNYVVINWVVSGTQTGVFRTPSRVAVPPTGSYFSLPGSVTFEIAGDKIIHEWFYTDMASLMSQIGLIPAVLSSVLLPHYSLRSPSFCLRHRIASGCRPARPH